MTFVFFGRHEIIVFWNNPFTANRITTSIEDRGLGILCDDLGWNGVRWGGGVGWDGEGTWWLRNEEEECGVNGCGSGSVFIFREAVDVFSVGLFGIWIEMDRNETAQSENETELSGAVKSSSADISFFRSLIRPH